MKDSCFSNWSSKNSLMLETEWLKPFTLYFFDFTVVILHPVFQLCLSVAHIWAHCVLVMCSYVVNGLTCAHILILVRCVICAAWAPRIAALQNICYFLIASRVFFRVFTFFLLIWVNWSAWKTWKPCNIWKSHSVVLQDSLPKGFG